MKTILAVLFTVLVASAAEPKLILKAPASVNVSVAVSAPTSQFTRALFLPVEAKLFTSAFLPSARPVSVVGPPGQCNVCSHCTGFWESLACAAGYNGGCYQYCD